PGCLSALSSSCRWWRSRRIGSSLDEMSSQHWRKFRPTVLSGSRTPVNRNRIAKQPFGLAPGPWQFPAENNKSPGMTTTTDDLRLAADFPPATYDDWRKLVDSVLKGARFEKLVGKTYDGLEIEPIYPRAKGASPIPGRAAATPWQVMQRIDHARARQHTCGMAGDGEAVC